MSNLFKRMSKVLRSVSCLGSNSQAIVLSRGFQLMPRELLDPINVR